MAVVRRIPVVKNINNQENKTKSKEDNRKSKKDIVQINTEERRKMEKEKLEEKRYNQAVEKELVAEKEEEMKKHDNQKIISEHSLEIFTASKSKTIPKLSTKVGAISIINSKNGRRILISKDVMNKLNNAEELSVSFSQDSIAIAKRLPNNDNILKVKNNGNKGVIYSSGLVSEVTNKYELDFNNRTSITFSEVNYIENDTYTVAIVKIK